jgi:hypothetical protein
MTPEEAAQLQKKYRNQRRKHAWKYSHPYSQDISKPPPGEYEWTEEDNG